MKQDGSFKSLLSYVHNNIQAINNSKMFAGLMIITLNIVSKFVNLNLSKSMEAYLRYTVSRQLLVFSIAWMGTRDIYIATFITLCFIIITDYLFNEDSALCILSENFQDYHNTLHEQNKINNEKVSDKEIDDAKAVLEKAAKQNKISNNDIQSFSMK